VIAAVNVVFPWSMCPIVPTLQCGFVRSNFCFAITQLLAPKPLASSSKPNLLLRRPDARSKRPKTALSRPIHLKESSFETARTPSGTANENSQNLDARPRDLSLDTVETPEPRTTTQFPGSHWPHTKFSAKHHPHRKPLPNPPAGHPSPKICDRQRTAVRTVNAALLSLESWR